MSPFQRVLVAGFIGAGVDDVDTNVETVRLLRSQMRSKSSLKVIEAADALPLLEIAVGATPETDRQGPTPHGPQKAARRRHPESEKDLEEYGPVFANTAFWRRVGEEYQNPLIVTGTVQSRQGTVHRDRENFDSFGCRRVVPTRNAEQRTVSPTSTVSVVAGIQDVASPPRTGRVVTVEFRRAA